MKQPNKPNFYRSLCYRIVLLILTLTLFGCGKPPIATNPERDVIFPGSVDRVIVGTVTSIDDYSHWNQATLHFGDAHKVFITVNDFDTVEYYSKFIGEPYTFVFRLAQIPPTKNGGIDHDNAVYSIIEIGGTGILGFTR